MNRLLGVRDCGKPGPLLILLGAVHGNETTGVFAVENVFRSLEEWDIQNKGKIVGILGNTRAYEKNIRYLDYDLNRCWTDSFVSERKGNIQGSVLQAEDLELLELLGEIEKHSTGDYSTRILVDLHATSSDNGNFVVIPQDEADHPVVKSLRLPIIVDLEKYLEGTLLEYMHHRNFVSFAFEGGLIGSERALNLHTSGIWEIIYASGMVERRKDHEFSKYDQILESFIHKLPHKVSVLYRHKIHPGDQFIMNPGYTNFSKVKKGEILARDGKGEILAKESGMIFMPLYQELGDDGFFIVEEIEGRL